MAKRALGVQRSRVVQEAARIICEDGLADYRLAKQKAVERLGLGFGTPLPSNADIQDAVIQYQRLFGGRAYAARLTHLRRTAVQAMRLLAEYQPRLVYLMRDMLRDVVTRGTGAKAGELGRGDLAGKTGTTNDEADAWFNGFNSKMVAISWVGFDQPQPLGRGEVGGRAALPMWMDFMKVALKGTKEDWPERPPGLVTVRVDPETGKLAAAGAPDAIFELVPAELVPTPDEGPQAVEGEPEAGKPEDLY